jgi:hypothetical protein
LNNPPDILQTYLRRLSKLSGNNRSLRLFRASGDQLIDLSTLQGVEVVQAFQIFEALLAARSIPICELSNSRLPYVNALSLQLRRLARMAAFLFEERGTLDLHIGWPMVRGKFTDGTPVSAPLLFFPVKLEADKKYWKLLPRKEAGITLNRTFLLAYFHYQQLPADEALLEYAFEDPDADTTVFRTNLYQLLKDRLNIRFTPDIYADRLEPFTAYTREEFEEKFQAGELRMFHQGVLGIFPQAHAQLMPDYLQMIAEGRITQPEDLFTVHQDEEGLRTEMSVTEDKLFAPFPTDTWQEQALKAYKSGQSVVVHGPPGTGKSQLIANLIADAMASGRRVLVVSQKRAALDVVYTRLRDAGLADFVALIHDFRHDLSELYAQLAASINLVDTYLEKYSSPVQSQAELNFYQHSQTISRLTEQAEEYKHALFDTHACGVSAKELYLSSNPEAPHVSLRQEFHHFRFDNLHNFLIKMRQYVAYAKHFEQDDYPLLRRKSFAGLPHSAKAQIEATIKQAKEGMEQTAEALGHLTGKELQYLDIENLWAAKDKLHQLAGLLTDETTFAFFQQMVPEADEETSLLWLQNMQRVCLNCFAPPGVEATLRDDQMGQCQVALQQRLSASRNIFKLIRWELFSDQKFFLKRVLVANGLPYSRPGLHELEQRLDNRLNLLHHLTALRQKKWLGYFPEVYEEKLWKKWFEKQEMALKAKLLYSSLRHLHHLDPGKFTRDEFIRRLWKVLDELELFQQKKATWLQYLSQQQLTALSQTPGVWVAWVQQLRQDFDNLCAFDGLKESLAAYERSVIEKLKESLQTWDIALFEQVFQNSLRLAWIDYLEAKYPVLRWSSTLQLEHLQQELQQAVTEKRKAALQLAVDRARQRTCAHLRYNRLKHRITYRDLYHQVTKKKQRWPLRKLMTAFADELFQLVPCWMASPETVSAVFPLQTLFDVVVFDEASQCFAEYGLPAMYRGKQVLIAGDPRQLRPFDLYQVRWKEEEPHPDLEVESLLELAMRYLPSVHLRGHYRSAHPELIYFSNRHFYHNHLVMLPHKDAVTGNAQPFAYVKVNGTWNNQTNEAEANTVVELLQSYSTRYPQATVGVVTFNAAQQELIQDKLAVVAAGGKKLPQQLFVKNIENIQGDERDIIIFSVAYAPDERGKVRLQFGSLSAPGGENRLNVAITRARQMVVVVTSLWPEELPVDEVKNEGPKLLRAYLDYVRTAAQAENRMALLQANPLPENNLTLANLLKEWLARHTPEVKVYEKPFALADLVVLHKGNAGIIHTDDDALAALPAKAWWVYFPQQCQHQQWPLLTLSSRNWWANREQAVISLQKFLYQLAGPSDA